MRRLALASVLLAAACGAPNTTTDGGEEPDAGGTGGGAGGGGGAVRRIVSLSVSPTQLFMTPGQEAPVAATATWDDSTTSDVTGTVTWTSTNAVAATVTVVSAGNNDARVRAVAAGASDVTASIGSLTSNVLRVSVSGGDGGGGTDGGGGPDGGATDGGTPGDGGVTGGELRAIWVTRFAYNTANDVRTIISNAAAGGYNVVYFQIRGGGDAFYQSSLVPWAQKLTGTLGQNPGWDPLQTAITEAHARGLQLHAYFNVFSAWSCSTAPYACACTAAQGQGSSCVLPPASPAGQPTHWLRAHPESMAVDTQGRNQDTEYYWFSPANAAYRAHVVAAVDELLTNYDVDGLHLDRIRYPGTWSSYDADSVSGFAAADAGVTRADWQRENVSSMVGAIYDVVKVRRPRALFSAAVWGIYTPLPGCNTSQGYGQYYQDSLSWVRTGRIDQLVPMTYWDIGTGCTDWARLTSGFVTAIGGPRVVAGMHAQDQGTVQPARLSARIQYARMLGAAGTAIFASSYFNSSTWTSLRADGGVYAADAGVPGITWR